MRNRQSFVALYTLCRRSLLAGLTVTLCAAALPAAPAAASDLGTILSRHDTGGARHGATKKPRSEAQQAVVNGWPLYRTRRSQQAFNAAMAALAATAGTAPAATAFRGCKNLACPLDLPKMSTGGWLPEGRLWLGPKEYVLIVNSPRLAPGKPYRRRAAKSMRYFVFHEFHNGTHNVDLYDTISSHARSVFVPFYLSKARTDAEGNTAVTLVQVAPYDVVSVHASNMGSAGPGVEVAKNYNEGLEPAQARAGIALALMVKAAAPQVRVVNHRGTEGRPMLNAYEQRMAAVRGEASAKPVRLPFVPADAARVAAADLTLNDLLLMPGAKPKRLRRAAETAVARAPADEAAPQPAVMSETLSASLAVPSPVAALRPAKPGKGAKPQGAAQDLPVPQPAKRTPAKTQGVSPLAAWLAANLTTLRQLPAFAGIFPETAVAIEESDPLLGVALLDASDTVLGRIQPRMVEGAVVAGDYVYAPAAASARRHTLTLDLDQPAAAQSKRPTNKLGLAEPAQGTANPGG